MRKSLKIVQIEEKSYFVSIIFFREKARQFCKLNQMLYSGTGHFFIYHFFFASRLLLKEVICKKRQKRLFPTFVERKKNSLRSMSQGNTKNI